MSELISGKEALIALANGQEVELNSLTNGGWVNAQQWAVEYFITDHYKFRLKPRTITINGVEVPAPFKPKAGEQYFTLDTSCSDDYDSQKYSYPYNYDVGLVWRTEEEIKQVVAALRSIFGKK